MGEFWRTRGEEHTPSDEGQHVLRGRRQDAGGCSWGPSVWFRFAGGCATGTNFAGESPEARPNAAAVGPREGGGPPRLVDEVLGMVEAGAALTSYCHRVLPPPL